MERRSTKGRFPHLRSTVALAVEVGLHHRSRVTPEAPRRPSDDRVAFHQPYQARHTGRTRAYGARSWRSSSFRDRHAGAERVKRFAPPGSSRPSKRTRNVMQGSVLIPSYGRSSRFGHEADHLIAPPTDLERQDGQRFRWSSSWWSPPPESNRRPHPYHGPTGTAVRSAVSPGRSRP